jgi:pimeloyl-ACP methyl ester carboxylesterase
LRLLLNKIQVKQLIIQGLEDQYGSIEQIKTINKNTHGHSTIFTPQCSHAPFIESTSEVIDEVVKFINLQINENTQN